MRSTIGSGTIFSRFVALTRTEVVENQQQIRADLLRAVRDLASLAAADERRGIDPVAALDDALQYPRSGGDGQRLEFVELGLDGAALGAAVHRDDDRALRHRSASGAMRSMEPANALVIVRPRPLQDVRIDRVDAMRCARPAGCARARGRRAPRDALPDR